MSAVFRWSGEYFGFWIGDSLFNADGENIAYRSGYAVWTVDGEYVGEVADESYIVRNTAMAQTATRMARMSAVSHAPLVPPVNRMARMPRASFEDATYRL